MNKSFYLPIFLLCAASSVFAMEGPLHGAYERKLEDIIQKAKESGEISPLDLEFLRVRTNVNTWYNCKKSKPNCSENHQKLTFAFKERKRDPHSWWQ